MNEKDEGVAMLDTSGLLCPMPVIRVQNQIKKMQIGDILEVICTDPGTKNDIPTWCRINGHEVLSIEESDDSIIFTIKKSDL